jgi:hypothetical protein
MKIGDYIKEYTRGRRITFLDVIREKYEFCAELFKFNRIGISEEFQDVVHFFQLWLYWRFGINGEIWKMSEKSVKKFIDRKKIWQEIYEFVGLDRNISGYVGNYKKVEKVIKHLSDFGIGKEKSEEAYRILVTNSTPRIN